MKKLLKVVDQNDKLLFMAEPEMIRTILNLQEPAYKRMEFELNETGSCKLHFNRREPLPGVTCVVVTPESL